jgi:hypothetical protein
VHGVDRAHSEHAELEHTSTDSDSYESNRDITKTLELPGSGQSQGRPIFVVQEHQASPSHDDFRPEADAVIKSGVG